VTGKVVDEKGVVVPNASDLIKFDVAGAGVVAAVDSDDNRSHEPFQANERRAWQGICFALLKSVAENGKIKLTASSPNLMSGTLEISVK
jgi:beta-galactosidase